MIDLNPILQAVRQSAILCREVQRFHISHSEKVGHEPVTIADYGSQAIICRALMSHFPQDALIAEESGQDFLRLVEPEQRARISQLVSAVLGEAVEEAELVAWLDHGNSRGSNQPERTWLIDPVDGTKGFLALRHFVIAVGILEDGQPSGAVVGAPAYPGYEEQNGALLHAIGDEAFIQPMSSKGSARRIHVSDRKVIGTLRALESVEKGHVSHERMARVRAAMGMSEALVEQADSQEKYSRIAAGDAELYLRLPRINNTRPHMIWDHAPGTALVLAAGGKVTDVDGSRLDFTQGKTLANNQGVIATNGLFHDRVVEAVQQVLAEEGQK